MGRATDPWDSRENTAESTCRVLVEKKQPLYRWYHTDHELQPPGLRRVYQPGRIVDDTDSRDGIFQDLADAPGVYEVKVSRYLLSIQLANELFSWDDIEPRVIEAIESTLGVSVRVVEEAQTEDPSPPAQTGTEDPPPPAQTGIDVV